MEFRCAAGDWSGAIEALDRNKANNLIDKPTHRRLRAVLLTAQAQSVEPDDRDAAKALALEAAKLAPDLVPAAAMVGRFHVDAGDARKASRVLDAAWKANPHPDIAEAYINLKPGDSARDKLARAQKLAKSQPGNVEGALALARAAIDAQAFDVARTALAPLIAAPTRRVALLMAELEEAEHGDIGRARAWTSRAVRAAHDPVWTADGYVSETWMPVSAATGRLDAFEWKVPIAELPGVASGEVEAEPVIDAAPPPVPAAPEIVTLPAERPQEVPVVAAQPVPRRANSRKAEKPTPVPAEMVIPLVHAPDDPGPDVPDELGPVSGPKQPGGWRKLLG